MGQHLGYQSRDAKSQQTSNQRNGRSGKTVLTEDGPLRIDVPRDRDASFEPLLIPKHERRFTGLDDKIVAMYADRKSTRLNSSHQIISYAVFCLKKKKKTYLYRNSIDTNACL